MSRIIGDSQCPECAKMGHDSQSNHLIHFEDGGCYCGKSEYHESGKPYIVSPEGEYKDDDVGIEDLKSDKLEARGISRDVAAHYGVKVEYDHDRNQKAYYYPVTKGGKVIAYKQRVLPKEFYWVGKIKDQKPEMFGQSVCAKQGKRLLIVEGQDDMLAACQMLWRKYPQYTPNVVSLIHGDKSQSVADNIDFINGYDEVLVYTDNDDAGHKVRDEIVSLIGPAAKIVSTSEKDANDMLKKGKQAEFINAFFQAKPATPEHIVGESIGTAELMRPLERGVYIDTLPNTMKMLHGFRPGELTIVLAPSHVGKTTVCKEISYGLMKSGKSVGNIFLEEDLRKSQQSFVALDNNVMLPKFRENPNILSLEQVKKTEESLFNNGRTWWMNHFGSIASDGLMSKVRWLAYAGVQFVVLDHISMVISGQQSQNERKDIDLLLTELKAFTVESGIHAVVVSHIKRMNHVAPKNKDGSVKYPYWKEVDMDQARGSGSFEQLADNVLVLENEVLESGERGKIRTRWRKNREWSWLGVADILEMHPVTGRLIQAEEEGYL